jgi:hypothetical protein
VNLLLRGQHVSQPPVAPAPFETPSEGILSRIKSERYVETRVDRLAEIAAPGAAHITLEHPTECAVYNTIAFEKCGAPRACMGCIEKGNKTLVGVLLRIPGKRTRSAPRRCEQSSRSECGLWWRRVCGGEESIELAAGAVLLVLAPPRVVLVTKEVVPQKWIVQQRLESRI